MRISALFLLVAVANSAMTSGNRAQIGDGNGPVELNHPQVTGAKSQVSVVCSEGRATLTITKTGSVDLDAAFTFKSGTCNVLRAPVPAGGLSATATENCGRTGNSNSYVWDVTVDAIYLAVPGIESNFGADFTVVCASSVNNPAPIEDNTRPPAQPEGTASYSQAVTFSLEKVESQNARQWRFRLTPTSPADLRGLRYQVNTLEATATNPQSATEPLSVTLIQNGCIVNAFGITVERGEVSETVDETFITVPAFQFREAANEPIDFEVDVTLCTVANGEQCGPLRTTEQCTPTTTTTLTPVVENRRSIGGKAVIAQRSRRSLSDSFFGKLTVKDIIIA